MKILYFALLSLATLVAPAIATGDGCISTTIDFSELPDGTKLKGGDYLSNEWWKAYGLTLSAKGGLSNEPRLFNTSDVGTKRYGDPDLGSPNERCPNPGPGKGEGGEPGSLGANCKPLGNVLIIQEDNDRPEIPDDNVDGGIITFIFSVPIQFDKIGLLDIDYASFLRVFYPEDDSEDIFIPRLGDNSVQTVKINKGGVYKLELHLGRSGAVTFFTFCYPGTIGRIGEACVDDDSCETGYCFYSEIPGGGARCACNPSTNAGCKDGEEVCAISIISEFNPPECLFPLGAPCEKESDCITGRCDHERNMCRCHDELNIPCAANEECTFQEGYGYACHLRIGEPCYDSGGSCATEYCFNAVLPGGIVPAGVCSCNPDTNRGCEDQPRTECDFSPLVDIGPPDCFLPMGETCSADDECLSHHCFEDQCVCNEELNFPCFDETEICTFRGDDPDGYSCRQRIGEPCGGMCEAGYCFTGVPPGGGPVPRPVCACNPETNEGCDVSKEVCDFSPLKEVAPPYCFLPMDAACVANEDCLSDNCHEEKCVCNVELNFPCTENEKCTLEDGSRYLCKKSDSKLGIDEDCLEDSECETDYCWADWFIEPDQPGVCKCNSRKNNTGCPEDKECKSPLLPGSAPSCFTPVGSPCTDGSECFSGSCFNNACAVCDETTNYPCDPMAGDPFGSFEICVFDENTGDHYCQELFDIDEPCLEDSECQSGHCWANWLVDPDHPGICKCNVESNRGCDYITVCQTPLPPGSAPSCFLPVGATCSDDSECFSGNCFDEACAACDDSNNYPCEDDEICTYDGDDLYCQAILGKICRYNAHCPFGTSHLPCFKEYPLHGPGVCVCDEGTNDGCAGGRTCAVRPGTFNTPPTCYALLSDPCSADKDCLSGACRSGKCVCNIDNNHGCADDEGCTLEGTEPVCMKCTIPDPVQCTWNIPMVCRDGCEYRNYCLAQQAGYTPRDDCYYSNKFESGPGGNLYKVFDELKITWTEASNTVKALADKCGIDVHLATISSGEEDVFVHELGRAFHAYQGQTSFWIGGFQNLSSPEYKEPGGGWEWVNGEGRISTGTHPIAGKYSNWAPKEPNDFRNQPQNPDHLPEDHMTVCRRDNNISSDKGKATGWNDEFEGSFIRGYIVEVEVQEPTVIYKDCNTKVDNLRLPPVSKECPPASISSLIEGCAKYNADPILDDCVRHIADKLVSAGLITSEERDSIVNCN